MANGMAENEPLNAEHPEWAVFVELLRKTSESLAKQIAKDGEGATKLIEVEVHGAKDSLDARMMAKQIVGSSLVKTAVYRSRCKLGKNHQFNRSDKGCH